MSAAKRLAEKIAVVEKKLAEQQERIMEMPLMAPAPVGLAMECVKEVPRPVPSKAERRSKLIAAHVALEGVRLDLGDYTEYEAINKVQTSIAAAIGRLELRD